MIDVQKVLGILEEIKPQIEAINGRSATTSHEQAANSRELQFLATRFELAAALTRHEYWLSRGASDHLHQKGA